MAELDFERSEVDNYEVQPVRPTTEYTSTHFIISDEIFVSTNAMLRHDWQARSERESAISRLAIADHIESERTAE
jgi:hypothetical protein